MLLSELIDQLNDVLENVGNVKVSIQTQPKWPLKGDVDAIVCKSSFDEDVQEGSSKDELLLIAETLSEYGYSAAYDQY